ncbi:MAG: TetR/AcrR family transcriptional regulator, partial [Acidobacteriota bacterium]
MATPNTADRLLDSAQRMVQLRGFNAFSYADLAEEIGIRSASIHYHFKTKVDLGEALLGRYVAELEASLEALDGEQVSARQRLELLIDGYRDTERCGFMCLCGSLASDVGTLPPSMRSLIDEYLSRTEAWVTREIERGARSGEFKPVAAAEDLASMLVCGLQGA